jgi:hypothetical protein
VRKLNGSPEGSIRPRGDKFVMDYYTPLGQRVRKTFSTRQEAQEALDKKRDEIAHGINRLFPKNVRFKDFPEKFLQHKENDVVPRTHINYRGMLDNHILPKFGKANLMNIDRQSILDFMDELFDKGLESESIKISFDCLRWFWRMLLSQI